MGFFDNFSDAVEATGKEIGKKASKLAHCAKEAIELSTLKNKLSREYEKLGKLVSDNEIVADIVCSYDSRSIKIINKIEKLKEQINEKERNKDNLKCSCGNYCAKDAIFCSYCGKKFDK